MKPTVQLAETRTPGGKRLVSTQHDRDFALHTNGEPLMTSRENESEIALSYLGCLGIVNKRSPRILIGGLGLGYTLRQVLDMVGSMAQVTVAELLPDIVAWNRMHFGGLTNHPLKDERVTVKIGDVSQVIKQADKPWDVILIDIDNGPEAISDHKNHALYSSAGLRMMMKSMHENGCLAIWSAGIDPRFEKHARSQGLQIRSFRVPAHRGRKSRSKCIWVGALDTDLIPDAKAYDDYRSQR